MVWISTKEVFRRIWRNNWSVVKFKKIGSLKILDYLFLKYGTVTGNIQNLTIESKQNTSTTKREIIYLFIMKVQD